MKIEFKQVLIYAIIPALIAGFFSVAPKLYEVIVEPKAVLRYTLVAGPKIAVDGVQQQVISVRVSNAGKKTLTAIQAELSVPSGSLAASSIENGSGLTIDSKKSDDKLIVNISKFLEGESFSISALLKIPQQNINPKFLVRSEEVLGSADEPASGKVNGIGSTLASALGAVLSVMGMALLALTKFKGDIPFRGNKRIAIRYIAFATKVDELIRAVRDEGNDITYMDFADMLFALGQAADEGTRRASIAALQCLLDVDQIADVSRSIVKRNLETLLGKHLESESQEPKVSIDDTLKFRNHVDVIFARQRASEV